MAFDSGFDIARNIRAIESIKVSLVESVAALLRATLGSERQETLSDALAQIIHCVWRLAGRLGVPMEDVNRRLEDKNRLHWRQDPDAARCELPLMSQK